MYEKTMQFNWQCYHVFFSILLSYLTGVMTINIFRNPTAKLPFKTFQELQTFVERNEITVLATVHFIVGFRASTAFLCGHIMSCDH